MKKFASMFAIALLACSMLVSSCKDDDESPSRTELLTAKGWQTASAEIAVAGQRIPYTDFWFEACDLDDVTTFAKDGSYSQNVGTVTCDSDDKNTTGTWKLQNSDNTLSIKESIENDFTDYKVVSMTASRLEISAGNIIDYDTNGDGKSDIDAELFLIFTAK